MNQVQNIFIGLTHSYFFLPQIGVTVEKKKLECSINGIWFGIWFGIRFNDIHSDKSGAIFFYKKDWNKHHSTQSYFKIPSSEAPVGICQKRM